jgi:hypothetical protein
MIGKQQIFCQRKHLCRPVQCSCNLVSVQHQLQQQQFLPSASTVQQWQLPAQGRFKCNIDAAFSKQFQRTGIGICLRDDSGTFVLARLLYFNSIYPVAVGESLGLFHALQWMHDMKFDNIDFELDSKITTDAFHSRRTDVTEFGNIIYACRDIFTTSFTNSRVEFTRRLMILQGKPLP